MARVADDIDDYIARAEPDDGDSWWAENHQGQKQAVRVLNFYEKSESLRDLVQSDRYQWLGDLTGDGHQHRRSAEGLVKPLGIVRGLSDLPWHKDCGQGRHSYLCNALTCGISVTGADRESGALGVVPGSHRANVKMPGRDPIMDMAPRMLETQTGDVTVHCSDTLHRAHPPDRAAPQSGLFGFWAAAFCPATAPKKNPAITERPEPSSPTSKTASTPQAAPRRRSPRRVLESSALQQRGPGLKP